MDTGTDRKGDDIARRACGVREAAVYLGVSRSEVRALIRNEVLPARRLGSKLLVEYSDLDALYDALPVVD